MKLLIFSHKICWKSINSPSGWATDGGFAIQMDQISSLFDNSTILVPERINGPNTGEVYFQNKSIIIEPINFNFGNSTIRKIRILLWSIINLVTLIRLINKHDVIHCPIPSDIGTTGMILTFLLRKPLFVRHCGNWTVQTTFMERFWKWFMEKYAGGNNLFLATGGAFLEPSLKNKNIKWIFSTSLVKSEILKEINYTRFNGGLKACIVCRIDRKKGVGVVIKVIHHLKLNNYFIPLTIVGDGPDFCLFKELVRDLDLEDLVTFVGKKNHIEVLEIMRNHHLFIYPTIASEGFPKVILEAMSQGLIVFTTPVSVLKHLINDGNNGFLVHKSEYIDFYEKMIKIFDNRLNLFEISQNSINKSKNYTLNSWKEFIKNEMISTWPHLTFNN